MVRFISSVAATVLLATATQAYRPGDEICTYATSGSSCGLNTITPSKTDGSVLIYPGGKTRCAFDDFKDPVTGYTANATYFFQVFPKPQKKKLVLFLAEGGACIDKATCGFGIQCSLPVTLMTSSATASSAGILNATDPNNAFSDWNIVHVPYCTGDLHVGNAVLEPFESGIEPLFGRPQCLGTQRKTYLNGFENTKAAFQWAKANYPDVDELVLGGMSAGSLGSQLLASYAADLWNVKAKGTKYGVLADSYVGVFPESRSAGSVLNFYGACDANLNLPASVTAACKAETLTIPEYTATMMQVLPESSWLFLNTMADDTQRLFYQLGKESIFGFPFPNQISPEEFFADASKILTSYKAVSTHVSDFIVSGGAHMFLNGATWYETVSTTGDKLGKYVGDWLASLSAGKSATPAMAPAK